MKLQSTTKQSDLKLDGIDIQLEMHNSSVGQLVFTDKSGKTIKIVGTYGVSVLIPAPPKMTEKWELSGKFDDLVDVKETFDTEYDANDRLREFERRSKSGGECGLTVKKVEVPEEG